MHPFDLLVNFEQSFLDAGVGVRRLATGWRGILVDVAETTVLVEMDIVRELIDLPAMTPVPLAERWVLGIANLRGNVLPVLDPGALLTMRRGDTAGAGQPLCRQVIVVRHGAAVLLGLAVERYRGVRHCAPAARRADVEVPDAFAPFVHGGFDLPDGRVPVLDLERLIGDPELMSRPLRHSLLGPA